MRKILAGLDWILIFSLLILSIFGIIAVHILVPGSLLQQLAYFIFAFIFFLIFSQIDYRILEKISLPLYLGSIAFLFAPLLFGKITRGSVRWIQFGPITIQPSEIVKPFLVIFFASFFSNGKLNFKKILIGGILLVIPLFLVFIQPDLGSSLVILLSWIGIVFFAGIPTGFILMALALFIMLLPITWILLKEYQRQRIISFLNPSADPLGAGYHIIQTIIAVGSGQFFGRGLGRGTQSQLKFLPERHTDFIFASLAEDLGFLGSAILILGFLILLWRILFISQKTKDLFGSLVCLGVFSILFSQIFINIGMNIGLLPITGITLPIVSYGGSSLVATMISLGIIENIAKLKKREESIIIGA